MIIAAKLRKKHLLSFRNLKNDPERAIGKTRAGDAETANLLGGSDMRPDARADIIIADAHQTQCLAGIFGQFVQFHAFRNRIAGDKLKSDRQIFGNQPVDGRLHFSDLFCRRGFAQQIIDFAFLSLDMHVF